MSCVYGKGLQEIVHYCLVCGKVIDFTKPHSFTFASEYNIYEYAHLFRPFRCDWDEGDEEEE